MFITAVCVLFMNQFPPQIEHQWSVLVKMFRRGEPTLRFPELRCESLQRLEGTISTYQTKKCYYDDNTNNS